MIEDNLNFYNFTFKANDGKLIYAYKWLPKLPSTQIKAAIQIVHGMGEHALRYNDFANYLTANGFAVYALDQRGHGKTAQTIENFGHQADKNGWMLVVDDIKKLTEIIKKENPQTNIFLFGHSAGSFLVRDYLIKFSDESKNEIKAVILSGTATSPGIMGYLGILISKYLIKKYNPAVKSPLHRKLTFEKYNSHFKPNRTTSDWISRDNEAVDKLLADPYCFTLFSATFYMELIQSTLRINNFKNIKKMPKNIPILLISGTQCSVGNYTKGIKKVYKDFIKAGIKDVELKLYKDARHELINELNKIEVYEDVKNFLLSKNKI